MTEFEAKFIISDFREHVIKKGLWAGSVTPITIPNLLGLNEQNQLVEITQPHTPALLKAIDEIIVNAVDHCKETKKVTKIQVTFNKGKIIVYNNGPGIPIARDKSSNKYLIEYAFSKFLAGTNIEKPINSIKGGTNGLGAKITNSHSISFIVETVYDKQLYVQEFNNRLSVIHSPIITHTDKSDYTKISFIPAYQELGYSDDSLFGDISNWLHLRMCQVSTYLGNKVQVIYNDTVCTTINTTLLANMLYPDDITITTECKNSENEHSLHITAVLCKKIKKGSIQNMTIINGVVSTAGSHIKYIRNTIKTYIDNKISKLTKGSSSVERKDIILRLIISGPIPGIDWSGQNKDTVEVSDKILQKYKINDKFLKEIHTHLVGNIVQNIKEIKVEHDKYIKARNIAKNKIKSQCMLFAAEGDSAITLLRTGLTQKDNKKLVSSFSPSFDWIGIISLQGVVINAAKEITELETSDGSIAVRSDKLKNNKRLNMLADAFGLKYGCSYTTQEELNSLNYGKLILCTDQDLDGTGKIASLVLVWIYTFWPALLKAKRVGKLMTPVIRAYKKNAPIIEFHYEQELTNWLSHNTGKNYNIKYYKGLATHDANEAADMFKLHNFNHNIYLYTMDDIANELFNIYFGTNPALRKQILITPVQHLNDEEVVILKQSQEIPIGKVQLNIDTKLYKNEAISRQLPHVIDGLNPARRKVLMASIIRFGSESKEVKVFQLAGYVADKMLYHHGDASLNKTIITMAQSFKGARKYPYLLGIGQFGDRHGSKAGSPRYISVKLNSIVNFIFPPDDRWILSYTFDEGIQAEPEYFIPIIPMAVLESYQIVTEGWNHKSYGRSLQSVLNVVYDYISGNQELISISDKLYQTKDVNCISRDIISRYNLDIEGDIRLYKECDYSFGNYLYYEQSNMIKIIELPIGVFTTTYIENITKSCDKYILKIDDYSSTNEIEIYIYLKPGSIDIINKLYGNDVIDAIEDCFSLRTSIRPNLNYYSFDKTVLECKDIYLASILYWAPVRKRLYYDRLIRKEIIYRLLILKEESIRYIAMSKELQLSSIDNEDSVIVLLKSKDFPGINASILSSPGYIKNTDLEHSILSENNYDYILNLKERELTKESVVNRKKLVEKYQKEYNVIKAYLQETPFAGASLWKMEIDILLKHI
jgi:DNA topoisomerase II